MTGKRKTQSPTLSKKEREAIEAQLPAFDALAKAAADNGTPDSVHHERAAQLRALLAESDKGKE